MNDAGRGFDEYAIQVARLQGEFERGLAGQILIHRAIDFEVGNFRSTRRRACGGRRALRGGDRVDGMENIVGAGLHIQRRLAFLECGGAFRKPRQRVEDFTAATAAHLATGRTQHFRRQSVHGLAFGALREHASQFSEREYNTSHPDQ